MIPSAGWYPNTTSTAWPASPTDLSISASKSATPIKVKQAYTKFDIDLASEVWFKEHRKDTDPHTATMNREFRQLIVENMLILLFAGHDTTASTIYYCYHMLHQAP